MSRTPPERSPTIDEPDIPNGRLGPVLHSVDPTIVRIEFFPLGLIDTNNEYQLHNGDY